MKTVKTMLS